LSLLLTPICASKDAAKLEALEKKLSYEDIRFYRSITRSQVRKERATKRQQEEEERKKNPPSQGWLAWAWGSSASGNTTKGATEMTDEQRKELYEAIDFDEKEAVTASLSAPKDALKMRIAAKLQTGSFTLRTDPHGATKEVISSVFDGFEADFIQRPENFEAKMTLGGLRIHDGTAPDTLYPQIVRVKDGWEGDGKAKDPEAKADDPLLMIKFEHSPLDERADNAVTVKLKAMEIIYHRGYVEAIYQFLKPPESQLESVGALLVSRYLTLCLSACVDLSTYRTPRTKH
jgi:vacuolar protein sorting-associated protein 13A/C